MKIKCYKEDIFIGLLSEVAGGRVSLSDCLHPEFQKLIGAILERGLPTSYLMKHDPSESEVNTNVERSLLGIREFLTDCGIRTESIPENEIRVIEDTLVTENTLGNLNGLAENLSCYEASILIKELHNLKTSPPRL